MMDITQDYIAFAIGWSLLCILCISCFIYNRKKTQKQHNTDKLCQKFIDFQCQVKQTLADMITNASYELTPEEMNVTWTGIFPMDRKRNGESEIEFFLRVTFNRMLTSENFINNDWDEEEDWDKCSNNVAKVNFLESNLNCQTQPLMLSVDSLSKPINMDEFIENKLLPDQGHTICQQSLEDQEPLDWISVCAAEKEETQKLYKAISKGVEQSSMSDFASAKWLVEGKHFPQSVLLFQQAMEKKLKSILLLSSCQVTYYNVRHLHSLCELMKYIPEEMKQRKDVEDICTKMESLGRSPEFTRKYLSLCVRARYQSNLLQESLKTFPNDMFQEKEARLAQQYCSTVMALKNC
jgi:HEPN domain-containing protein